MKTQQNLYIAGAWRAATGSADLPVTDSYTEQVFASCRSASRADVDAAVQAARAAFDGWSATPLAERVAAVRRVAAALRDRSDAIARVISREVGMPAKLSARIQAGAPIAAWELYAEQAAQLEWEQDERPLTGQRAAPSASGAAGKAGDKYDIVVSNIISAILIRISADVADAVEPGGQWIVSGIILGNWPDVRAAAESVGFSLEEKREEGDWVAARFRRSV